MNVSQLWGNYAGIGHLSGVLWLGFVSLGWAQTSLVYQPRFREPAEQGLGHLYNCSFEAAGQVFEQLRITYPQHPGPPFLQALNLWWQLSLNTEARSLDGPLVMCLDRTIALAEAQLALSPADWEAEFLRYSAWGFKARLQVLRGELVAAGRTGLKILPVLKRTDSFKPLHPEFLFGSGLYLYFREWYAERKPALAPVLVFFPSGSKTQGLAELKRSVATPNYTSTEAAVFLTEIYLFAERTPELALPYASHLVAKYPENPYFRLWYAKALYHARRFDQARSILEGILHTYNRVARGRTQAVTLRESTTTTQLAQSVCLYYGLTLQRLNLSMATAEDFLRTGDRLCVLNGETNTELRAQMLFQLGNCLDRQGKREEAKACYIQVIGLARSEGYARLARRCRDAPCTYYTPLD